MPKKKKSSAQQPKKLRLPILRGLRRAESIARQIGRWVEQKWPMNEENAGEWLQFAAALKAKAMLIEADALKIVNPSYFAKSRADIMREKLAAKQPEEGVADDET